MTQTATTPTTPTASANNNVADPAQEAMILSTIQEISHIATLPEITLKIIRIVEDPESSAQDLNKVITNDPALGARILKVVNSAFYGLPGQIGSINRAIVLLGLNAVKNIGHRRQPREAFPWWSDLSASSMRRTSGSTR